MSNKEKKTATPAAVNTVDTETPDVQANLQSEADRAFAEFQAKYGAEIMAKAAVNAGIGSTVATLEVSKNAAEIETLTREIAELKDEVKSINARVLAKIVRVKELGASVKIDGGERAATKCGTCSIEGHNTRTCPSKVQAVETPAVQTVSSN